MVTPTQRPNVGEPTLTSTATSKISPWIARTSLPCGRRELQVQASDSPADGLRVVVLHERSGDARRQIFFGVIGLEKEPARVAMHVGLDHDDAGQVGRFEPQRH